MSDDRQRFSARRTAAAGAAAATANYLQALLAYCEALPLGTSEFDTMHGHLERAIAVVQDTQGILLRELRSGPEASGG